MVKLNQTFVASDVPPETGDFPPMPDGWYRAQIMATEERQSRYNPENRFIAVTFEILGDAEGKYAGRKIFVNLNLWNTNTTAAEIAVGTLSSICHAVGKVQGIDDTDQLHGIPMEVKLKTVPPVMENGIEKYAAKNDISGYRSLTTETKTGEPNPTQQMNEAATDTATASPNPPWM